MKFSLSVVIPTYRRPELLDRCLSGLMDQTLDPALYEIIVVDNAGSEETRDVVRRWSKRPCPLLRYLQFNSKRGPAAARNHGWRAASGEIIAFTDDDTVPTPGWLKAGLKAFNDEVAGVWGKVIVPVSESPTDYEREIARLEQAGCITANCFYRRAALAAVGGFDERFTVAWREDSDIFFSFLKRNERVACASNAIVVHPVRTARWGVSIAQQRKSMFNALLYKKHPRLYRQHIQPAPPWRYYGIVGSLLAAGLSAVSGQIGFVLVAGMTWLFLTADFCLERLRDTSKTIGHIIEMVFTSVLIPPLSIYWRLRGAFKYRVFFM